MKTEFDWIKVIGIIVEAKEKGQVLQSYVDIVGCPKQRLMVTGVKLR